MAILAGETVCASSLIPGHLCLQALAFEASDEFIQILQVEAGDGLVLESLLTKEHISVRMVDHFNSKLGLVELNKMVSRTIDCHA